MRAHTHTHTEDIVFYCNKRYEHQRDYNLVTPEWRIHTRFRTIFILHRSKLYTVDDPELNKKERIKKKIPFFLCPRKNISATVIRLHRNNSR